MTCFYVNQNDGFSKLLKTVIFWESPLPNWIWQGFFRFLLWITLWIMWITRPNGNGVLGGIFGVYVN